MSLSRNRNFQFWKEVEAQLRSTAFTCLGDPLVEEDRLTVSQVFTLWALVIQDLCGASRLRSDTALRAWLFQVGKYPLNQVVDTLKSLSSFCRDYNRDMGEGIDYASFKQTQLGKGKCSRLLLSPIADVLDVFLRECHSTMLQCLLTCLEFPCRMTINRLPSLLKKEKDTYRELEAEMKTWQYPEDLLDELAGYIRSAFLDWPGFSFFPKHGGGVTSDASGRDSGTKYSLLRDRGLPPRLHHYFCQKGISHPLVAMHTVDKGTACRVLLVPKGVSSKRVISCEPTANQWFQQALLRDLADYLPSCPIRITMEDQTRNQKLAQVGSLFRNYGTIDLSSASDTVTYPLVRHLFKDTPIWDELWSSRTSYALLDGQRIELTKFSPMGSAVCFPVESLVFSAVVAVAQEHVGVHHDYVVYGDDIICHSSVFDEVIRLLELLHFRVNEKKTFWPSSPFKESCGKEYYYGDDVTPFRIPRFFHGWNDPGAIRKSPQVLAGWISLANSLMSAGLERARRYLVARLLELCPSVLFSENTHSFAVTSWTRTNFHVPERFESNSSSLDTRRVNLCRGRLVKGATLLSRTGLGNDDIRYQMLLEQYIHTTREALQSPDDLIDLAIGPSRALVQNRWVPEYLLSESDDFGETYSKSSTDVWKAQRCSYVLDFVQVIGADAEWRMRSQF